MTSTSKGNVLPPGRRAGVCLHITSLPGPYGIGEIGEAAFRFNDAVIRSMVINRKEAETEPSLLAKRPEERQEREAPAAAAAEEPKAAATESAPAGDVVEAKGDDAAAADAE